MKRIMPILLCFAFVLSACNINNPNKREETFEKQQQTLPAKRYNEQKLIQEKSDNRMNDESLLQSDDLLIIGDSQVEKAIPNYMAQNPPNDYDKKMAQQMGIKIEEQKEQSGPRLMHHSPSNPALHPVFKNPKVKPIWGAYTENPVYTAWQYFGTPYQYGSNRNDPSSFDCSDFTRWIYLFSLGMDLPKDSRSQWEYVKKFSKHKYTDLSQAKRGDLLFFMNYKGWQKHDYAGINVKAQTVGHCGIYLGNGQMLHTASAKTGGVRVDTIKGSHLEYRFIGGGSIVQ